LRENYPGPNHLGVGLPTLRAPLFGVPVAWKVLLGLCIVAVAVAAWRLNQAAGHSRWLLLAVLPWLWHPDVFVGHVGAIVGLPLFLLLLAVHLPFVRHPGPWRALAAAVLIGVLAVTHLLLWFMAAAMLPILAAAMAWRRDSGHRGHRLGAAALALGRDLLLSVPSLAVLVPWLRRDVLPGGPLQAEWTLPVDSLKGLFSHMFDQFAPRGTTLESLADLLFNRPGDPMTGLWLLGLALWLFASVAQTRARVTHAQDGHPDRDLHARSPDGTWYLGWAFTLALVGYFALPTHLFRPVWVHGVAPRLTEVVAILGVLALPLSPLRAPQARWRALAGTLAMFVVAVWMPLATVRSAVLIQPEFAPMREAFEAVPPHKTLLVLRPSAESHWMQAPLLTEVAAYYAVYRGGVVPSPFIDPQLQQVRWKPERMPPQPPGDDQDKLTWFDHARFYDYIAVLRDPFSPEPRYEAMLRTWKRVFQRGRWQVFRNPSPEAWPPPPPPPVLDEAGQAAAGLVEDVGQLLGWGWGLPVAQSRAAVWRENQLRRRLGWPERGAPADSGVPLAEPATPAHRGPSLVAPLRRGLMLPPGVQRRPNVLP
ncbi:MAG: hypothetical protein HY902_01610, partial [Deltaproteobacteria bacterium]|nr:hypothetical protein [Deltaproteobacteria bacterium]